MFIALTGTPGTGKTSVADILREKSFDVIDLNKLSVEKGFVVGIDKSRDSKIVDTDKLDDYITDNFGDKPLIFIEGHLSHLLKCVDRVIVLRCHPDKLKSNLSKKKWSKKKIEENVEAEILDVILSEAVEVHSKDNVVEIDATNKSIDETADIIVELVEDGFKNIKKYKIGKIDWSEEILKNF